MVDLVKIRKKKAEKKKAEEEARAAAESASHEAAASPSHELAGEGLGEPVVAGARAGEDAPAVVREPAERQGAASPSPSTPSPARAPAAAGADASAPSKLEKFKAEAGRRRATAEAGDREDGASAGLEALTFTIEGEQYAVDIERIVEIVTPRAITRIPNADASVVGIISLRGTIVTLLDVRRPLRHPPAGAETADTRIIVIDYGSDTVGFVVDRVLRVVKAAAGEIEPPPVVHSGELNEAIRGVFRVGGALTILLDLDKLLAHNALAAGMA